MNEPPTKRRAPPRMLSVIRKEQLTPHMLRVTLGGELMTGFPEGRESANFKLLLPQIHQAVPVLPTSTSKPDEKDKPIVRTYTVRNFDPKAMQVDVDFFIHKEAGPASQWAQEAKPGDKIGFGGPGPAKLAEPDRDWYLFAGDMSALPAISANIEKLPRDAKGYVLLEIIEEADKQSLPFPENFDVRWLINPEPEKENNILLDAFIQVPWLQGRPYVWVAGESSAVKKIRAFIREVHSVEKSDFYCSGYWQIGMTEDIHQVTKRSEKL
jgi:NADPH-dependent ferric siderophore reductase